MAETARAHVVVVGGGPAGIAAAATAAENGARVTLVDEGPRLGGQIWRHRKRLSTPAVAGWWMGRMEREGVERFHESSVIDGSSDGTLVVEGPAGASEIRAEKIVIATGARELFLPFPGWTLPNVVGVGAIQALIKAGASFRGKRVIVAGSGPLVLPVAALLARQKAELVAVAEQADAKAVHSFARHLLLSPRKLALAALYRRSFFTTPYQLGTWVSSAEGSDRVEKATLTDGDASWTGECDVLCAGCGLVPNVELARWLGCKLSGGYVQVDEHQQTDQPGIFCAGEPTSVGGVDLALVEGEIAGLVASSGAVPRRLGRRRDRLRRFARLLDRTFKPRKELADRLEGQTTVCRCEDVEWGRIDSSRGARQTKLETRVGMGPCQGRVCGPALTFLCGWSADSVRPPLKPSRISSLVTESEP